MYTIILDNILIFITNENLDDIDPAFIRPGRIDKCFMIRKPTPKMRRQLIEERWHDEILEYLDKDNRLDYLMEGSDGFSFAELESIKSILVTNKLMGTCNWDIEAAFKEFHEGRETFSQTKYGNKRFGFYNSYEEIDPVGYPMPMD